MKKYSSLLLVMIFILAGCTDKFDEETNKMPDTVNTSFYQEIDTKLSKNVIDDFNPHTAILKEKNKLQRKGKNFWSVGKIIEGNNEMIRLEKNLNCKEGTDDCALIGFKSYKNNTPPNFVLGECDSDQWCVVTEPKTKIDQTNKMLAVYDSYTDGNNIYTIGAIDNDNTFSIMKNDKNIFSHKMFFGADGPVMSASTVLNLPSFSFRDLIEWKNENEIPITTSNIWYNNETINEKYSVEASSYLFSYKDKIGFIGKKDGKFYIFFNGKKISGGFDEIRTEACCAILAYPIEIYENGILFLLARKGEKYFFVETNLEKYLNN